MLWATFVLIWIVCAGFAALIASRKGRSMGGFALAGFLFGPVGLLCCTFARSGSTPSRRELDRQRHDRLSRPIATSGDWRRHLPES